MVWQWGRWEHARGDEVNWDAAETRAAWSFLGVGPDDEVVIYHQLGALRLSDLRGVLPRLFRDAILLGGSADVQQYLRGCDLLNASPRPNSSTANRAAEASRPLGAALLLLKQQGKEKAKEKEKEKSSTLL